MIASWYFAFLHFFYAIAGNWWLDMWLVDEFSSVYHIFNRWKIRLLTFKSFVLRRKFALPSFNDVYCAGKRFTLVRIRAIVHFNGWAPATPMLLHYYSFFCLHLLEGKILWIIFFFITIITIIFFFFLLFDVFVILIFLLTLIVNSWDFSFGLPSKVCLFLPRFFFVFLEIKSFETQFQTYVWCLLNSD